ncbi:MAG: PAS domain S-box protein [Gemmatimonadota bacterium]
MPLIAKAVTALLQFAAVILSVRFVVMKRLGYHWLLVSAALAFMGFVGVAEIPVAPVLQTAADHRSPYAIHDAIELAISLLLAAGFVLTERWFLLKERLEGRFRLIAEVDRSLVGLLDEEKILSEVCDGMTRGREYRLAWIGRAAPGGSVEVVRSAGDGQGLLAKIDVRWDESPEGRGPAGSCLRTGEACVVDRIGEDPRMAEGEAAAAAFGLRSCASVRVDVGGGPPTVLTLYSAKRNAFDAVEMGAISALAGRLGAAVVGARRHALFVSAKNAYDDLLRTQRDGIICVRGGKIVRVNPAAVSILGYNDATGLLGGDPAVILDDPDGDPDVRSLLRRGDPGAGRFACEAVVRRGNGGTFVAEIAATWLPRPDGLRAEGPSGWTPEMQGPLGMFVIRDITRRKEAMEDLRGERDLRGKILGIVGALVVQLGPEGEILLVNRQCEEVTGYRAGELAGRRWEDVLLPASARSPFRVAFANALAGGIPANVEYPLLTKSGETRLVAWSHAAVAGPAGKARSVIAAGIDFTDRRRLEEQVVGMQKMEAVGTLAGGIAHDFNNILTGILGNLDIARKALPDGVPASEAVHEAIRASERAAVLIRQLLEFSRRSPLERRAVDVAKVLREVVHLFSQTIDRRIAVGWTAPDDLWLAAADVNQTHQVLMNLCVNARDAVLERLEAGGGNDAPPGGYAIRLAAESAVVGDAYCRAHKYARPGEYVLLTVSDNGTGMDEATQRRVFEPFFTTKKLGRGTGLGLSTVYGIVKQHDGWINMESAPGKGTVFSVYLPRAVAATAADASSEDAPAVRAGRERILFVDDEEMIRNLGRRILERDGYTVVTASDGREALDIFASERAALDIVILDMTMPLLSGLEVLERMRALDPGVRVILSSGYPVESGYAGSIGARPAAFLQKPYRPEALSRLVRDVLDGRSS